MNKSEVDKLTSQQQATEYINGWKRYRPGNDVIGPNWAYNAKATLDIFNDWRSLIGQTSTSFGTSTDSSSLIENMNEIYESYKNYELPLSMRDSQEVPALEQMRTEAISIVTRTISQTLGKYKSAREQDSKDRAELTRKERGYYERAGNLISNYFTITSASERKKNPPKLNVSDDISMCKPLDDLTSIVIGEKTQSEIEIASEVSLPFSPYEKFDHNKLDHDFKMNIIHKDINGITKEIRKHASLMDDLSILGDIGSILEIYGEKSARDALKRAKSKLDELHKDHGSVFTKQDVIKLKGNIDTILNSNLSALIQSTYQITGNETWAHQEFWNGCIAISFTTALRAAGWHWDGKTPYISNWAKTNDLHSGVDKYWDVLGANGKYKVDPVGNASPSSFMLNLMLRRGSRTGHSSKNSTPPWEANAKYLGWMCSTKYSETTTGNNAVTGELYSRYPSNKSVWLNTMYDVSPNMPFRSDVEAIYSSYFTYDELASIVSDGYPCRITIRRYHNKDFKEGSLVPANDASGAHSIAIIGVSTGSMGLISHDSNRVTTGTDGTLKHARAFYRKIDGSDFNVGDPLSSVILDKTSLITSGKGGLNHGGTRDSNNPGKYKIAAQVIIPSRKGKSKFIKDHLQSTGGDKYKPKAVVSQSYHVNNAQKQYADTGAGTAIKNIVSLMISRLSGKSIRLYTNDIKGKVENLSIDFTPGTCKYIPIEGENAPVVQSTGGRTVQVSLRLTEVDEIDLSKLAVMFKVANREDTLLSMLQLSRSVFNGESNRRRIRFTSDYMHTQRVYKTLQDIEGKKIPPRFDEPVRINNDVLNGLGLTSFIPYNMEVQSDPNRAQAFTVQLTLNYVNLGNRSIETLRRQRGNSDVPILPIASRLGHDAKSIDSRNESTKCPADQSQINVMDVISKLSVKYSLAEFIPLYILYKLEMLIESLISTAARNKGVVDTDDPFFALYSNMSDSVRRQLEDSITTTREFDATWQRNADVLLGVSGVSGSFLPHSIGTLSSAISSISKGTGGKAKLIVSALAGLTSIGTGVGSAIISSTLSNIEKERYNPEKGPLDRLYINIPTLVPYMMYSLVQDFLKAHQLGKEEEFIMGIANGANRLLAMEYDTTENTGFFRRIIKLKNRISIKGSMPSDDVSDELLKEAKSKERTKKGIIYDLKEIVLDNFVAGVHEEVTLDVNTFGYTPISGSVTVGLADLGFDMSEVIKKGIFTKGDLNIQSPKPDDYMRMTILAAAQLNALSIEVCKEIQKMKRPLGDEAYALGNYELAAIRLIERQSSRSHAIEVLKSVVIMSGIDLVAGHIMMASKRSDLYNMTSKMAVDLPDTNDYSEEVAEGLKAIGGVIPNIINNILEGGESLKETQINNSALISGAFVDDMYPTAKIRKGLVDCMNIVLKMTEDIGTGRVKTIGFNDTEITRYIGNSVTWKTDRLEIPEGFVTTGMIATAIEPSSSTIAMDSLMITGALAIKPILGAAVTFVAYAATIIIGIVMAPGTGGASLLLSIVNTILLLLFILEGIIAIIDYLTEELGDIIIGTVNLTILSEWLAARLRDGTDAAVLVNICHKANIWSRHILSFDKDARDTKDTTFVDYPVVVSNGMALSPDFFIHKVGQTMGTLAQVQQTMTDMIQVVDERYSASKPEDYDQLLQSMITHMESGVQQDLNSTSAYIDYAMPSIYPNVKYGLKRYAKSSEERMEIAYKVSRLSNIISHSIFADENRDFVSVLVSYIDSNGLPIEYGHVGDQSCFTYRYNMDTGRGALSFSGDRAGKGRLRTAQEDWINVDSNQSRIFQILGEYEKDGYVPDVLQFVVRSLKELAERLIEMDTNSFARFVQGQWGTLGGISLLRGLIRHNMNAVGQSGRALMKSQMNEIGHTSLLKSVRFRSGYMFPTIKLFFIEEDMDTFYLFDDLYSYSSVISVSVHMDRTSAIQTAMIKVTNIHGNLSNILADRTNMENNFMSAPDENSPINAIMLRPGAKIKLQAGNTPTLSEHNTIFTGRITSVNYSDVVSIEAQSHGDVLLEDLATDQVKLYGAASVETQGAASAFIEKVKSFFISLITNVDGYVRPITRVRDIVSYVLTDLITTSTHLDDFSTGSSMYADMSGYENSTNNIRTALYLKYAPEKASQLADNMGVDIDITTNKQLYENIHIVGDAADERMSFFQQIGRAHGNWIVSNESAWDILNEINILLPNNILTVRPYDTRGTIVWGDSDGYYRYRREVELGSLGAVIAIRKLNSIIESSESKMGALLKELGQDVLSSGARDHKYVSFISLIALIVYYARGIYLTSAGVEALSVDTDWDLNPEAGASYIKESVSWFLTANKDLEELSGSASSILQKYERIVKNPISLVKEINKIVVDMDKAREKLAELARRDKYKSGIGNIRIEEYADEAFGSDDNAKRKVRLYLTLEIAATEVINFMRRITYPNSTSHRKISELHMKMSGRDIVRNEIKLQSPFNSVKLSHPSNNVKIDDLAKNAQTGLSPVDVHTEVTVPLHRTLKPWIWKVYSTFFKNINVFPDSITSVKSMVISSVLSNLMKETYAGQIVLLGDPTIRENDRILIWDENRDMYGIVGVRSHTFIISQEEGCLSIIEPDMITKTMYGIYAGVMDTALWIFGTIVSVAMFALMAWSVSGVGIQIAKRFKYKSLAKQLTSKESAATQTVKSGTSPNSAGLKSQGLIGRLKLKVFDKFRGFPRPTLKKNLHHSEAPAIKKARDEITRICAETTRKLEDKLVNSETLSKFCINKVNTMAGDSSASIISASEMNDIKNAAWTETLKRMIKTGIFGQKDAQRLAKNIGSPGKLKGTVPETSLRRTYAEELSKRMVEFADRRRVEGTKKLKKGQYDDLVNELIAGETSPIPSSLGKVTPIERVNIDRIIKDPKRVITSHNSVDKAYSKMESKILEVSNRIISDKSIGLNSGQKKSVVRDTYEIARFVAFNNWGIANMISRYGNYLAGIGLAQWGLSQTKDLVEMWCVPTETQDNVILSPIYFRGEPFIAGVESINKEEGKQLGIVGIMKARFSDVMTAGIDSLTNPIANSLNLYLQQEYATSSRVGTNNPLTGVETNNPFNFVKRPRTFTKTEGSNKE